MSGGDSRSRAYELDAVARLSVDKLKARQRQAIQTLCIRNDEVKNRG